MNEFDSQPTDNNEIHAEVEDSQTEEHSVSDLNISQNDQKLSQVGKKKNKKKAKKAKEAGSPASPAPTKSKKTDDDLDELLKTIPDTVNAPQDAKQEAEQIYEKKMKSILRINPSLLDPNAEMKRMFGTGIVERGDGEGGANLRAGGAVGGVYKHHRDHHGNAAKRNNMKVSLGGKGSRLGMMKAKAHWPVLNNDGLEMSLVETRNNINYFKLTWSKDYKRTQRQFHACVETGDPQTLAELLRYHPFHVDTLLQLHDAFQMTDQKDTALDLLERLVWRFQASWHPKFDPFEKTGAQSTRLLYSEPENRTFMLGILSYIQDIGSKGCSQTALEWTKLLLSLDLSDPLGLLFLVDHFALRRREHLWLLQFYHNPLFSDLDLPIMPNFLYSVALSAFYYKKSILEASTTTYADTSSSSENSTGIDASTMEFKDIDPQELLHTAILSYPQLFVMLLNRLAINSVRAPGCPNVLDLPIFKDYQPPASILPVLSSLYIERNHAMWKDPNCVQWLKDCAVSFYQKLVHGSSPSVSTNTVTITTNFADISGDVSPLSDYQSRLESYRVLTAELDSGLPRIYRHVMLCEFNSVIRMLPSDILRDGFHIYSHEEMKVLDIETKTEPRAPLDPRQAGGNAGTIARVLDYLIPWQADPQQLQNILNLIGYRIGNEGDEEDDVDQGEDD